MTESAELALLIEEQRQDDTHVVWPEKGVIALDALFKNGESHTAPLAPVDPRVTHGTESTYVNYRCRCKACTAAASAASVERQRKKAEREPWHGTYSGYKWHGCKCKRCVEAVRRYDRMLHRTKRGLPLKLTRRRCAREDCDVMFMPSKAGKIYCTHRCACVVSARNSRARQAARSG